MTWKFIVHERWGKAGFQGYYPTLCGLSPLAQQSTSDDPENVTCEACIRRRLHLEEKGLLEALPRRKDVEG